MKIKIEDKEYDINITRGAHDSLYLLSAISPDGEPAGSLSFRLKDDRPRTAWLINIEVNNGHSHLGYGTALVINDWHKK